MAHASSTPSSRAGPAPDHAPAPAGGCACCAAATARRLAMIERLAEIGMEMAEVLRTEVVEPAEGRRTTTRGEAALAFNRIARAVRLSATLAGRIRRELYHPEAGAAGGAGEDAPAPPEGLVERAKARIRLLVRKEEVGRITARAVEAEARERGIDVEALVAELDDRPEPPEMDDVDWLERPLGELAARVCRDLGVRYDPALWDEGDEGEEEPSSRPQRSGEPGPRGLGSAPAPGSRVCAAAPLRPG